MYQWNRIEIPEINPFTYDQLIYDKEEEYTMEKKNLLNKLCWENRRVAFQKK